MSMFANRSLQVLFLTLALVVMLVSCGDENAVEPERDLSPPSQIVDFAVDSIVEQDVYLSWTAPGSNLNEGQVAAYEFVAIPEPFVFVDPNIYWWLAISDRSAITMAWLNSNPAGTMEELVFRDQPYDQLWRFALRTYDETGNHSSVSNIPTALAVDDIAEDITLTIYSDSIPNSIDTTFSLDTEGTFTFDLHEGSDTTYTVYIRAARYFTELVHISYGSTFDVDLDKYKYKRNSVSGVIIHSKLTGAHEVVAGTTIDVTGPDGSFTLSTDDVGRYELLNMTPGDYQFEFTWMEQDVTMLVTNTAASEYKELSF